MAQKDNVAPLRDPKDGWFLDEMTGRMVKGASKEELKRVPVPVGYLECPDCHRWPEYCRC